jgi:hypothetical protein
MGDNYTMIFIIELTYYDLDEKMEDGGMGGACSTFSLQTRTEF